MRIESISLQGFKSFGEKTRIEFVPGINAVIGPNGSGKSNVIEAIRWATHTARVRELRAGNATELIFHGSQGKSSLGLAEVMLELSGLHRSHLPERLNLARRVYRDGDTEQELLGKNVLVRDIQNALRGSGLGPGGLAAIGQGEVSGVVTADSKTLLGYLEEAAGLSALTHREKQTLDRLVEVERHLEQLELVAAGVRERTEQLNREAETARKHTQYTQELQQLQDAVQWAKHQTLTQELQDLQVQEENLQGSVQQTAADLREVQAKQEELRLTLQAAGVERAEYESTLRLIKNAEERVRDTEKYLELLQLDQQNLLSEMEVLEALAPVEKPTADPVQIEASLRSLKIRLQSAERRLQASENELKQAYAQAQEAAREEAQNATLQEEASKLQALVEQETANLKATEEQLVAVRGLLSVTEEQYRTTLESFETARKNLQVAKSDLSRANNEKAPLERELKRLEVVLNSYARYGEGSRNALNSDIEGIVGSVADCLNVPEEYETAITAALGRRLEQVVVQNAQVAQEIIEHLKRAGGRATFLPLDLIKSRVRPDSRLLTERGVLGYAHNKCPSDPPLISEHLLGDTLMVQDHPTAIRIARNHAQRPRLVTLDGEVIEATGAVTGGKLKDSGLTVLADQRRYHDLQDELDDLDRKADKARKQERSIEESLKKLEDQVRELRLKHQQEKGQEAVLERTLTQAGARRDTLQSQLRSVHSRMHESSGTERFTGVQVLEDTITQIRQEIEVLRAQEQQFTADLHGIREQHTAHQHHQQEMQRLAANREKYQRLQGQIQGYLLNLDNHQRELAAHQSKLASLSRPELLPLEKEYKQLSEQHAAQTRKIAELQRTLENTRLNLARKETQRQELGEVKAPEVLPEGDARRWTGRIQTLERLLMELGAINALAEQEHEHESRRLQTMEKDIQDTRGAIQQIRDALRDLRQDIHSKLFLAFERVKTAFSNYAQELLGGLGELQLEQDENGKPTGMGMVVQPRSKRTRNIHLLSAGERTMVGLAFLFALSEAPEDQRGLPIAILDEVDAPLDEANIRRFTHFLKLLASKGSQFILVTHQKATMEIAHALWGVTTDAKGVSRTFSIKNSDIETFVQ
ncbi:chromosome segregation protein SMC [Deinococcus cellulosilyticus]|uniref:Chromosome partition protein Smc n=1 Tax=Deinococcus cellulosilyticus (strain DSM 18568 / NBRC 106333 / KACC 11606 / 5516J-15) TaxID=1223518 RepID=A0A511N7B4_DEIC1|nr:chromosome segregation protein SMC [Deinococcus cellulosilyticus]GEM48311.1 Smc1/Cut3/Cut14 family protein [Deinococcus cellulosilyticus NBRC 106333 = KACC 11606]